MGIGKIKDREGRVSLAYRKFKLVYNNSVWLKNVLLFVVLINTCFFLANPSSSYVAPSGTKWSFKSPWIFLMNQPVRVSWVRIDAYVRPFVNSHRFTIDPSPTPRCWIFFQAYKPFIIWVACFILNLICNKLPFLLWFHHCEHFIVGFTGVPCIWPWPSSFIEGVTRT